jgi:hypothetical protein
MDVLPSISPSNSDSRGPNTCQRIVTPSAKPLCTLLFVAISLSSYPEPILLKIQTPRIRDNPIDSKFPVDILLSHRRVMTIKIEVAWDGAPHR